MHFLKTCSFYFLCCSVLSNVYCFAQAPAKALEFSLGTGKIVRNYPEFPGVSNAVVGTVKYSAKLNGSRPWHRYYNHPMAGLSLTAGSLGNRKELGNFAGLMMEMSFEKKISEKLYWAPRLSMGFSVFDKPFDEQNNPGNIVIGSTLAFFVSAEGILGYEVSKRTDVIAKLTIYHSSNSHFALPNVGMNLPALALGLRYHFNKPETPVVDTSAMTINKKIKLNIRVAYGINEYGASTGPVNGPKSPVYLASVFVSKMFSPINKVTAGVEGWYNKGIYDFIVSQDFYDTQRKQKSYACSVFLGHEFLMGNFGLIASGGIYLYNPFYRDRLKQNNIDGFKDKLKAVIPARIGVQYYLKNACYGNGKNLFAGLYIKTNFGQADFLEGGVGYVF